jgi:MFS family permease
MKLGQTGIKQGKSDPEKADTGGACSDQDERMSSKSRLSNFRVKVLQPAAENAPTAQLLLERRKRNQSSINDTTEPVNRKVPLDKILNSIGCGPFHDRLWWICGFGFSAAAIEVVLMAFLLPAIKDAWQVSDMELGIIPTAVSAGSVLGKLGGSAIADHIGRRRVFCATAALVSVAGVASAFSTNIAWLCVTRFFVGLGFGGNIAVDFPMYTEFLPTSARNNKLFIMQVLWPVGQIATCLFAWITIPRLSLGFGWRAFVMLCAIPSIVSASFRHLIPESPRWLACHGYGAEATAILKDIALQNGKSFDEVGLTEGVQVSTEIVLDMNLRRNAILPRVLKLLSPELYRTTLGLLMFSMSLGTAGYGICTLMPTILARKGIPATDRNLSMLTSSFAEIPGVLLAMVISGRYGRLLPIRLSLLMAACALALLANAKAEHTVVLASCIGSFCLEASWSLYHVYVPEAFPTELRATAMGTIEAASSLLIFWIPLVSAYFLETLSTMHTVMFFATSCFCGAVGAVFWLHVETLGRDLEDSVS